MAYDCVTVVEYEYGTTHRPHVGDHADEVRDSEHDELVSVVDLPEPMEPIEIHEYVVENPTFLEDVMDEESHSELLSESLDEVREYHESEVEAE